MTTRATTQAFTSSAVETVIVSFVAHLIKPLAVLVVGADHLLALVGVHVALVVSGAVVVLVLTKTSTPRNTLGLARITVVTVTLVRILSSHITLSVIIITLGILSTAAYMPVTGRVGIGTVRTTKTIVSTAWLALPLVAIVTEVSIMRGRNITNTINMLTIIIGTTLGV